jgi:hypothetical protein
MSPTTRAQAVIARSKKLCTQAAATCAMSKLLTEEAAELLLDTHQQLLARRWRLRGGATVAWPVKPSRKA